MGVYIPPPNDKDDGDKKKQDTNSNTNQPTPPSSSSPSGSTTIYIPNPASLIPRNPKVGLIWGPLTPASDNLPALYSMIGLQFVIGCGFFKYARTLSRLRPIGGFQQQPHAHMAPKLVRTGPIWKIALSVITGSALSFGSGLELCRVTLPYDPWYDEAQHYRRMAVKNGDKPSSWFGAYRYYKPMDFKTWIDKVGDWIENVEKEIKIDDPANFANLSLELGKNSNVINVQRQPQTSGGILNKLNNKGKYLEIYTKLNENNTKRWEKLLHEDLNEVTELNKAPRLDLILEGKSDLINPEFTKFAIILGNHTMDDDDQFEMVWLNFEPWDELKLDTEYDIRLVPSYAGATEEIENEDQESPLTDNVVAKQT